MPSPNDFNHWATDEQRAATSGLYSGVIEIDGIQIGCRNLDGSRFVLAVISDGGIGVGHDSLLLSRRRG
jgi:hypothetical protein